MLAMLKALLSTAGVQEEVIGSERMNKKGLMSDREVGTFSRGYCA